MDFGFILAPVVLFVVAVVLLAVGIGVRSESVRGSNAVLVAFAVLAVLTVASTTNGVITDRNESLFLAAQQGDLEEVENLLGQGADPNARWESGQSALEAAEEGGHHEVAKVLRKSGARP